MASRIANLTFGAGDALALATFWAAALGSDIDEDSTPDQVDAVPGRSGPALMGGGRDADALRASP